jgi:hypothetical protein
MYNFRPEKVSTGCCGRKAEGPSIDKYVNAIPDHFASSSHSNA